MMHIKIIFTLHVCLFLRELIQNLSIVLTVILKKAEKLQKRLLRIESKVEYLGKLNV